MLISDLIERLEKEKQLHGDLPIITPSEHYDQYDDGAGIWTAYKHEEDTYGFEIACDGDDFDSMSDEELEDAWGVSDRTDLVKVLVIS